MQSVPAEFEGDFKSHPQIEPEDHLAKRTKFVMNLITTESEVRFGVEFCMAWVQWTVVKVSVQSCLCSASWIALCQWLCCLPCCGQ